MYKRGWAQSGAAMAAEALAQRASWARTQANFYGLAVEDAKAPKPGNEAWAEANLFHAKAALSAAVANLPSRADAEAVLADVLQKHGNGPEAEVVREAIAFNFGPEEE